MMNPFLVFIIVISTFSSNLSAQAQGGCGGHGGDAIAQEFFQIGTSLLQRTQSLSSEELIEINSAFSVDLLANAVQNTRIISTDEPLFRIGSNGIPYEVDALNFTDQTQPLIKVNRARWLQYKEAQLIKKEGTVLHEYLGIMKGISSQVGEWDEYSVSTRVLTLIAKRVQSSTIDNLKLISTVNAQFNELEKNPFVNQLALDLTYSCIQYSLINPSLAPLLQKNVHASANLSEFEADYSQNQTDTQIHESIRVTKRGDLILKWFDKSAQLPISISYCSKLGSQAMGMLRLMKESMNPVFDLPKTRDYARFRSKVIQLSQTDNFRKCSEHNSQTDCLKFFEKFGKIPLAAEGNTFKNLVKNLTLIKNWVDSLSMENAIAGAPAIKLFNQYLVHQSYIKQLLDLGDPTKEYHSPPNESSADVTGIKNFVDSLEHRVPMAYENAQREFLRQAQANEAQLIQSFSKLY